MYVRYVYIVLLLQSVEGKKALVWYKKTIVICHYEGV